MKKRVKSFQKHPLILFFFGFILLFSIADILTPDREMSEMENRTLTQAPVFSLNAFTSNEWTRDYGEYTKDQFLFRDAWVSLQSFMETIQGKLENGGVWFAQNEYLISKNSTFSLVQQNTFNLNTEAVSTLAAELPGKVNVMLVPSPANILHNELRYNPPQIDENTLLDTAFSQIENAGAQVIDVRTSFVQAQEAGEPIYYHTDHHWTTTGGAWLAYEAFCEAQEISAIIPEENSLESVPDFYGTNYARARRFGTQPDTLEYYDLDNPLIVYRPEGDGLIAETGPIMNESQLDEYDKYAAFLRGNNGYSVIEGDGDGSILVVKDSYGNSFIPYLVANYETIGIIDLRAWFEVKQTFEENGYDEMLILYSFDNFSTDPNIVRMLRDEI